MTITKEFASKLAVAFVAVAMVFSAFATSAKAQTTEDLQQMINDLLAQVAALQAQAGMGGATAAAGVCPYTWTRDLSSGSTGADVMKLQQFLNSNPDTRVAATGVGSAGMETEYYGPATAAAVSKFQVANRAAVLSPAGLVNPTGYFGPSTRAAANAQCVAAPVVSDDTTMDDSDDSDDSSMDDSDDSAPVRLSGEASLKDASLDDASDDTIEEGADDTEVAELTVEFEDGDAEISRLDVKFNPAPAGTDPWDVLDEVSLWVDGDKVASKNADDKDDYQSDDMTLRFSGLDLVGEEDEELDITIAVTLQGSIDTADQGDVVVSVPSIRYFDADGVATTDTGTDFTTDTATFTIEEAGADDELIVKTSSNDPDGTTLQVEEDSKSDWYNVFTFDLDTDDSVNDIELTTVVVTVNTTVAGYSTLVDDAEINIDGINIDDVAVVLSTTTIAGDTAVLTFDVDGDVTIDAGDRVEAELMLRFKSLATANEGATVMAQVTGGTGNIDDFEAEGADDLLYANNQLRGAAEGDVHTLRTAGVNVSADGVSAVVTTGDAADDDYATYSIALEVTAFEQDVYISTNVASSVAYAIEDSAGVAVAGSATVVVESTGDESGGAFEITEGSTETITITVTFDPTAVNKAARLNLNTLTFAASAVAATNASTADDQTWTASPDEDYRTPVVTIVN